MLLKTKKGFIFTIFTTFFILFTVYHAFASPSYVSLISPQPNSADIDGSVTFNCNVSVPSTLAIENVSLWGNWSLTSPYWHRNRTVYPGELNPENSLVLLFHLNNDSAYGENDTYVYDFSGKGNHGRLVNSTTGNIPTSGKLGGGFKFNGTSSGEYTGGYLNVSDSPSISITGNITVSAWVKLDLVNKFHGIVEKYDNFFYFSNGYALRVISTNNAYFWIVNSSGSSGSATSTSTLEAGKWYFLAGVYNGTHVSVWINGTLEGSTACTDGIGNGVTDLKIGADGDGRSRMNGTVDEVAIYNRSLNSTEIYNIYNYTKTFYNASFNVTTLPDGYYKWNCLASYNNSQSEYADANWTFTVDKTPTNVTLVSPSNGYVDPDGNVTFNCSVDTQGTLTISNVSLYGNWSLTSPYWHLNQTKYPGELNSTNAVLLMHLNNDSSIGENNTRVVDSSYPQNNGTIVGATWVNEGKFGKAMNFSTSTDRVEILDSSDFNTNNFTIEAWIKFNSFPTSDYNYYTIFKKDNQYVLRIGATAPRYLQGIFWNSTSWYPILSDMSSWNLNRWYHVAFTYNGSEMRLYINGTLNKTQSQTGNIQDSSDSVSIGNGYYSSWNEGFPGLIDEVAIYNYSKSANEIAADYAKTSYNASFNITNLPDGRYKWNCLAYYNNSQSEFADNNWTFTVDKTAPIITWESPTSANNTNTNNNWVYLNTTIIDNSTTSAFFDWNYSLVGYWAMDWYNSTGVYDNSTWNNFGKFNGANFGTNNITTGKYGKGLSFDGVDDSLVIPDSTTLSTFDEGLTISLWIKSNTSIEDVPIAKWDEGYGLWQDNKWYFINATDWQWVDAGRLSDNQWHMYTVVWNLTHLISYRDGTQFASNPAQNLVFGSANLTIGKDNRPECGIGGGHNDCPFNGSIDEVMIFNRPLSPEEINASYNNYLYRLYHNFTSLPSGIYDYYAYAIDTYGNANKTGIGVVTVNSSSVVSSVSITPSIAYTNDSLNCRFNITDGDLGNSLSVNVTWYMDNNNGFGFMPWHQDDENNLPVNNSVFNETTALGDIEANKTFHNHKWKCSVNAYDGTSWSGWSNSSERTISNYTTSLNITNETGKVTGQQVLFTANYSSNKTGDIKRVIWNTSNIDSAFSLAFYDGDLSGKKKYIAVGQYDQFTLFYPNGTLIKTITYPNGPIYEIGVGDLDNDSYHDDIVLIDGQYVFVYNGSGDYQWDKSYSSSSNPSALDVNDLNGDGIDDVAVIQKNGTTNEIVFAFYNNGTQMWNASIAAETSSMGHNVLIADINKDGANEVLTAIHGPPSILYVLHGNNGSQMFNYTYPGNDHFIDVGVGNIDNDNYNEIMISTCYSSVLFIDHNGTFLDEIGGDEPGSEAEDILVLDLNDDGYDDVIVSITDPDIGIRAFTYNISTSVSDILWTANYSGPTDSILSFSKGDIDDDGQDDIIAGGQDDTIWVLNKSGGLVFRYYIGLGDIGLVENKAWGSSIATDISDINDDGINDIAVASNQGYVHVLQDVNCIIQFNDSISANMTWNSTSGLWNYNRSFEFNGTYSWNATCSKGGYDTVTQSSTVNITFKPQPPPHSIQIELTLSNTNAKVYIPGIGEYNISTLPNNTYANPSHYYLASYMNNMLIGLVYSMQNPLSISTNSSGSNYTLGLNQSLDNSMAFLVFTKNDGSGWRIIDKRINLIEAGKFLTHISPSFSFGLGLLHPIKIILKYTDIEILGDKLIFRRGTRDIVFENNGTINNEPSVYIRET